MKKKLSTVLFFLFKQICFSIMTAPKDDACTGTFMPIVWSEKPI